MDNKSPMLMHSTYFDLGPNNTPDVASAYMADALSFLSNSPGLISFWIGTRSGDIMRRENDRSFDIAMHQVFQDEDAFNRYNANDSSHNQFVADVDRWTPSTTRRVMDTYLTNLILGGNRSKGQSIGPDSNFPQRLFHSIYFSLLDKSPGNIAKFTAICVRYLAEHPGISQFSTGGLTDIKRDVSVRNFDVGVDIIYESKQAFEDDLLSPDHEAFFLATATMIEKSYFFDAYLKYQSTVYALTK